MPTSSARPHGEGPAEFAELLGNNRMLVCTLTLKQDTVFLDGARNYGL